MCESDAQPDVEQACPDSVKLHEAEFLWDEYKYRHEHCWKTLFRLTASTVALSIIPYLQPDLVVVLEYWIALPPLLGLALIVFGMFRIRRELELFYEVKKAFYERQTRLFGIKDSSGFFNFRLHIWMYLGSLLALGVANLVFLIEIWIPAESSSAGSLASMPGVAI